MDTVATRSNSLQILDIDSDLREVQAALEHNCDGSVERKLHVIVKAIDSYATTSGITGVDRGALSCLLPRAVGVLLSCKKMNAQGQVDSTKFFTNVAESWLDGIGPLSERVPSIEQDIREVASILLDLVLTSEIVRCLVLHYKSSLFSHISPPNRCTTACSPHFMP